MLFQYFSIGNPKIGDAILKQVYYEEHRKGVLYFFAYRIINQIFIFLAIISLVFVMF